MAFAGKKAPATPRFDSSSAIPISSNMPHSCQMEGLDLAGLRFRRTSARRCQAFKRKHGRITTRTPRPAPGAGLDAWLDPRPALRTSCTTLLRAPLLQQLLPRPRRPSPRPLFQLCRLQAMRRARRHLSLRPLSRPPPRRLLQLRRLQATRRARRHLLSSDAAFPPATALACRHLVPPPASPPTYPPRHPARLAQPPALPL
eukprot:tig00001292_g8036.t1